MPFHPEPLRTLLCLQRGHDSPTETRYHLLRIAAERHASRGRRLLRTAALRIAGLRLRAGDASKINLYLYDQSYL
ncbi:hypothetical protein [Lysobacter sp. TAB13]|uniref:hypothetical protein n=1 Tax=Lysobacter sp. TAB13 TaxID=3233065 RepID=UPI003F980E9A